MYLDFYTSGGHRYARIVRSVRKTNNKGITRSEKEIVKSLGVLSNLDDGLPDLEKRLREQFKAGTLVIPDFDYKALEKKQEEIIKLEFARRDYPKLRLQNIGYYFLDVLFEKLGIGDVLRKYKSNSNIEYDLVNIVKTFTYQRVMRPDSKRGTMLSVRNHPMFDMEYRSCDHHVWDRCLDVLNELFPSIQKRMDTKITKSSIGRKKTVTYYYLTHVYFEIPYQDEPVYLMDENKQVVCDELGEPVVLDPDLHRNEKSNEERRLPIDQISLAMDENALPLAIDVYSGNESGETAFKDYLDSENHQPPADTHAVYVADDGIYSQDHFYRIVNNGNGYIIRKSTKKSWNSIREWVHDDNGWVTKYSEQQLTEEMQEKESSNEKPESHTEEKAKEGKKSKKRKQASDRQDHQNESSCPYASSGPSGFSTSGISDSEQHIPFQFKSRVVKRKAQKSTDSDECIQYVVRETVYWSEAIYKKDKHEGEKIREALELAKKDPNILKHKNDRLQQFLHEDLVNPETGEFIMNPDTILTALEEEVSLYEEQFGYLIIETTETAMNELVALGKYHGLSRIESSFRISKSDLELRPVHLSMEEQIRAHVLICYIAFSLVRIIQYKILKHRSQQIKTTLKCPFGLTADDIQQALLDYQVSCLSEPYYLINDMSEIQQLLNETFGVPELETPTKDAIRNLKHILSQTTL